MLGSCSNNSRLLVMLAMTTSFFLVELVVGYMSKSNALVADSFHMMSDMIALLVAYVCVMVSPKAWSKSTFGFARAEVLGALVNAVFLMALCFTILVDSIKRFVEVEEVESPLLVLVVGSIGLVFNLIGLVLFGGDHGHAHGGGDGHGHAHGHAHANGGHKTLQLEEEAVAKEAKVAGKTEADQAPPQPSKSSSQLNIRGVFLHLLADALGSVIVIVSALIIYFFQDWSFCNYVDPSLSIILVLIISYTTWPLLKDSAYILLQTVPEHLQVTELERRLRREVSDVAGVHEFHIWQLVASRVLASIHVQLKCGANQRDHMQIAQNIKRFFHRNGIHSTTIQLEFSNGTVASAVLTAPAEDKANENGAPCVLPCPTMVDSGRDCSENQCCTHLRRRKGSGGGGGGGSGGKSDERQQQQQQHEAAPATMKKSLEDSTNNDDAPDAVVIHDERTSV